MNELVQKNADKLQVQYVLYGIDFNPRFNKI